MNKVQRRIADYMKNIIKTRNQGECRKNALEYMDNPYSFANYAPVTIEVDGRVGVKLHVLLFTPPPQFKFIKCLDFYGKEEIQLFQSLIKLD